MKKTVSLFGVLAAVVLFSAFTFLTPPKGNKYVGTNSCKACHNTAKTGKQYAHWQGTAHANAFKTLQSAEADKIAAGKGIKGKAVDAKECLSCHVTGMNESGAAFDKKFDNSEGVGCEACHGAGSGYKTKHNKPEKLKDAIAAGMQLPKVADGSAEKHCKTCHNKQSPTFKGFDFAKMWDKVAHPLPK